MPNRSRTRRDLNQTAFDIVARATGETPAPEEEAQPEKDPAAVSLGRRGGLKGGRARAEKMTPEERSEAARKAAEGRWKKG